MAGAANPVLGNGADARRPGPTPDHELPIGVDEAWQLLLVLRQCLEDGARVGSTSGLGFCARGAGWATVEAGSADILFDMGGTSLLWTRRPLEPLAEELMALHLGHAARRRADGYLVAVLGQSLDGFIATCEGHSRYINGQDSLIHLHRVRALSDAVVIGVSTAIADCPQLTTRHVDGPDAVRVVIDPHGRLPDDSGLLRVEAADHVGGPAVPTARRARRDCPRKRPPCICRQPMAASRRPRSWRR